MTNTIDTKTLNIGDIAYAVKYQKGMPIARIMKFKVLSKNMMELHVHMRIRKDCYGMKTLKFNDNHIHIVKTATEARAKAYQLMKKPDPKLKNKEKRGVSHAIS